jgi:hypothetical protein
MKIPFDAYQFLFVPTGQQLLSFNRRVHLGYDSNGESIYGWAKITAAVRDIWKLVYENARIN